MKLKHIFFIFDKYKVFNR